MKSLTLVLLIWATSLPAFAAEPLEGDAATHPAPARKVMDVQGVRGVWFRQDVVDQIIMDKEELLEQRKAAAKAESALVAQEQVTQACKAALGFSEAVAKKSQENLETAIRRAREAEEDRNGWFAGKPAFWVAVGLVGSLITAIVVDKIQESP